jgi:hypothetical protein
MHRNITMKQTVPKDTEELGLSLIAGGNAKWLNHFGKQCSSFLETSTTS